MACLCALAASLGWLAPLLTLAVASLDEAHGVRFGAASTGARVTLTHDRAVPVQAPWHRHCGLAAALTALAPDGGAGMDHVLDFPRGADQARIENDAASAQSPGVTHEPVVAWVLAPAPVSRTTPVESARPVASGALLRSSPLLI